MSECKYGKRPNGTCKGAGFYGEVPLGAERGRPENRRFMTEVGGAMTDHTGKIIEFPYLYKNMPADQFWRLKIAMMQDAEIPRDIQNAAFDAAVRRIEQGLDPFATPEEEANPMATPALSIQQLKQIRQLPEIQQFLAYIRKSEGGKYDTRTNGDTTRFPDGSWEFTQTDGKKNRSTAAGAYQFLRGTWKGLASRLGLKDFSPESQDLAAIQLIADNNALEDIISGNPITAVKKLGKTWASFPSSNYKQPKRSWKEAHEFFGQPYNPEDEQRLNRPDYINDAWDIMKQATTNPEQFEQMNQQQPDGMGQQMSYMEQQQQPLSMDSASPLVYNPDSPTSRLTDSWGIQPQDEDTMQSFLSDPVLSGMADDMDSVNRGKAVAGWLGEDYANPMAVSDDFNNEINSIIMGLRNE